MGHILSIREYDSAQQAHLPALKKLTLQIKDRDNKQLTASPTLPTNYFFYWTSKWVEFLRKEFDRYHP